MRPSLISSLLLTVPCPWVYGTKARYIALSGLLALAVALAGCGGAAATPESPESPTNAPAAAPSATSTPASTAVAKSPTPASTAVAKSPTLTPAATAAAVEEPRLAADAAEPASDSTSSLVSEEEQRAVLLTFKEVAGCPLTGNFHRCTWDKPPPRGGNPMGEEGRLGELYGVSTDDQGNVIQLHFNNASLGGNDPAGAGATFSIWRS